MLRLRRHRARSLLVAPFVLVAAACGGSGSDAAEPVRTDAPVAAAPAGPAATVTPAEICALLTGDEVATAVTVDGFDPGAFTFAAPTILAALAAALQS